MKLKPRDAVRQAGAVRAPNGLDNAWQGASLLREILPTPSDGNSVHIGTLKLEDVMGTAYVRRKFYRLPEVLKVLQVSRAKFLQMVKDGQAPPPIKCGRCALYVADEIDRFAVAMILSSRVERPFDINSLISKMGQY